MLLICVEDLLGGGVEITTQAHSSCQSETSIMTIEQTRKDNLCTGLRETFNDAIEKPFIIPTCWSNNRQVLSK